ncbi:AAC(3) family N-acetyltransferase [Paenibacillus qinlingensis]|uniref:AAC(3) family N-acetyltransferase n=1 Tax=Paenibacillus qinlingensis TaxID=1837343 RepID=UPI00156464E8|nr:AAC(3) family N-acetyltransferase [Paenibacillus qinlingensis]NQX61103.1 AAC(3) family N-acetyltransferase [Paenibacillus qinlingensis]
MFTKTDLIEHLQNIGVDPLGTLKIHISYKAIGAVEGGAETVLDALSDYMKDGLIVLGAHTWRNVGTDNPVCDNLYTPTCIGALTELFRKHPGVVRSLHPTHSVAAFGKDAESFIAGEEHLQTPCGVGGTYHKLWQRGAQILLIGVNFSRNTFIHGVEEWDGAVGTISAEKTDLYTIGPKGDRHYTPQFRHCARVGSNTFTKLEPEALSTGVMTLGKFGNATTRLMSAKQLRAMVAKHLKQDPNYLTDY